MLAVLPYQPPRLPSPSHSPISPPSTPMAAAVAPGSSSNRRGRKRNDDLPPNRARDVQRAFRARRAAHLQALEQRVAELEEENSSLRAALSLPPANRPPLGRGPTGKDRPRSSSVTADMVDIDQRRHPSSSSSSSPPSITSIPRTSVASLDTLTSSRMPPHSSHPSLSFHTTQATCSPQSNVSHTSNTPSSQSSSLAYSPISMRRAPSVSPGEDSDPGTELLDSPDGHPADLEFEGSWDQSMVAEDLEDEEAAVASSSSSMTTTAGPYKPGSLTLVPPHHPDVIRLSSSYPPSATHVSLSPATTSQSAPSPMPMFMSPQAELNCHYFGHRPEESRLALAYLNRDATVADLVESSAATAASPHHRRSQSSFPDQNTLSSHSFLQHPHHHGQPAMSTHLHDMSTEVVPNHPSAPMFGSAAAAGVPPPRRLMMHSSPPVSQMMDITAAGNNCNNSSSPHGVSAQSGGRPLLTYPHHAFSYSPSPPAPMSNLTGHGSHVLQSTPGEGGSSSSGSTGTIASPHIVSLDGASSTNMMHFTRPSGMYSALLPDGQYHTLR